MTKLDKKVIKAKTVIKKAFQKWQPEEIAVAWTGGKDSTTLLHLVLQTVPPNTPFQVIFNDSTIEFPQIYQFINNLFKLWKFNLVWIKHSESDLSLYRKVRSKEKKMEVMRLAKIHAIENAVKNYHIKAFLSGIRWDEQAARSQETYFSPRGDHLRVHPILHFTLADIWEYIHTFNVPYVDLYDKGYKSLGEAPFTKPATNADAPERSGREATKEKVMARLRKLGYW